MAISLAALGVDRMNRDEKLELLGQLWDSIIAAEPPGGLLSETQREELRRRLEDAEAHPTEAVSWEEAYANTVKRLSS